MDCNNKTLFNNLNTRLFENYLNIYGGIIKNHWVVPVESFMKRSGQEFNTALQNFLKVQFETFENDLYATKNNNKTCYNTNITTTTKTHNTTTN